MSSYLTVKDGIYDPTKRFAFTNIDSVDFTFSWGGQPITVKAKQTVELPHHLAVMATGKLVDKLMLDDINTRNAKAKKASPLAPQSSASSLGVPEARKVWEDKVLRELAPEEESPQLSVLRAQIKEELQRDLAGEKAQPISKISVQPGEFSEIKNR